MNRTDRSRSRSLTGRYFVAVREMVAAIRRGDTARAAHADRVSTQIAIMIDATGPVGQWQPHSAANADTVVESRRCDRGV